MTRHNFLEITRAKDDTFYAVAAWKPVTGLSAATVYQRRAAGLSLPTMTKVAGRLGAWGSAINEWLDGDT